MKNVGLALSDGGARGAAHIGVLKNRAHKIRAASESIKKFPKDDLVISPKERQVRAKTILQI